MTKPSHKRLSELMDAGNSFCEALKRPDAMAFLAVAHIVLQRSRFRANGVSKAVYIVRQLKRKEEVDRLRAIYGKAFIVVGAYSIREDRKQSLIRRFQENGLKSDAETEAEKLLKRDLSEADRVDFGQNVQHTFPLADVFLQVADNSRLIDDCRRLVELLFGRVKYTPTREEQGMYFAYAAALRSGSLARQVGAALTTAEGSLISVGTNEVAKAGGGQLWEGDKHDDRDVTLGYDQSDSDRRQVVSDVFARLKDGKWLAPEQANFTVERLVEEATRKGGILRKALVMDVIEFMRAVHAEQAAMMDAAMRGVPIAKSVLHVTTFPCHECARLIVAAGVREVVFVEPYPKSRAAEQYPHAIHLDGIGSKAEGAVTFRPFIGIAPKLYSEVFEFRENRKDQKGKIIDWSGKTARCSLSSKPFLYESSEYSHFIAIGEMLQML